MVACKGSSTDGDVEFIVKVIDYGLAYMDGDKNFNQALLSDRRTFTVEQLFKNMDGQCFEAIFFKTEALVCESTGSKLEKSTPSTKSLDAICSSMFEAPSGFINIAVAAAAPAAEATQRPTTGRIDLGFCSFPGGGCGGALAMPGTSI